MCGGKHKLNLATAATRVAEPDASSNCKRSLKAKTNEGSSISSEAVMSTVFTSLYDDFKQFNEKDSDDPDGNRLI